MSDWNSDRCIRGIALEWAVRSFTDLEQPRNARGYTSVHWRTAPKTEEVVERAKAFETFLKG